MSKFLEQSETNSSNMNDITIESEFKFNNYYYNKITSIYNKKNNIFNKKKSNTNKYRKINFLNNFSKDNINNSKSTNQSEENKTKFFKKEKKAKINKSNSLFNNTFLREKQKKFRLNLTGMRSYHIYLDCDKKNSSTYNIVDNNPKMFQAFLNKNKSNFNNKYNIIYSISNWRKKGQIHKLFNSIKKYQNKYDFSNYLENKLNKRCLSANKIKINNNISRINNNNFSKLLLLNQEYNFMENIRHKNNLIKIKTMNYVSVNFNKTNNKNKIIFDNSNVFFKTMLKEKK